MLSNQEKNVTIGEILIRLKDSLSVESDYKLAKMLNINPSNISMWRKRDSIPFKLLNDICNKRDLNYNYILYGEGHPEVPGSIDAPKEPGLIPVVGLAEAGAGIFSSDGDYPPGISDTYLSRPHGLKDQNAFAIRIEGESMMPAFKPGQIVIVSPNMECQNGDVVVANLIDNGNVLGEMKKSAGGITIVKYNADDITVKFDNIKWCYPVVWHKRR